MAVVIFLSQYKNPGNSLLHGPEVPAQSFGPTFRVTPQQIVFASRENYAILGQALGSRTSLGSAEFR